MNSEQWMRQGWTVLFRQGNAILYRPGDGVFLTEIDSGDWMRYEDLTKPPWVKLADSLTDDRLHPVIQDGIVRTLKHCYCDKSTRCDFCTGVREPPEQKG